VMIASKQTIQGEDKHLKNKIKNKYALQ